MSRRRSSFGGGFLGGLLGAALGPLAAKVGVRLARWLASALAIGLLWVYYRLYLLTGSSKAALLVMALGLGVVVWAVVLWRHGRRPHMPHRGASRPTAVYRLWEDDLLLYVGVAYDVKRRMEQHEGDKHWWWRVKDREVTWYASREEALAEETAWITGQRGPRPFFNVAQSRNVA